MKKIIVIGSLLVVSLTSFAEDKKEDIQRPKHQIERKIDGEKRGPRKYKLGKEQKKKLEEKYANLTSVEKEKIQKSATEMKDAKILLERHMKQENFNMQEAEKLNTEVFRKRVAHRKLVKELMDISKGTETK